MKYDTRYIVYPEGDEQEVEWPLKFNELVDVAGRPMRLPVATTKTLAFRVYRVSSEETRNEHITRYHLEQLFSDDLAAFTRDTS